MPTQSTPLSVACIFVCDVHAIQPKTRHTSTLYQLRISLCLTSIKRRLLCGITEIQIGIKSLNRFYFSMLTQYEIKRIHRLENRDQQFVRISINTNVIVSLQQIDASCRRRALFCILKQKKFFSKFHVPTNWLIYLENCSSHSLRKTAFFKSTKIVYKH